MAANIIKIEEVLYNLEDCITLPEALEVLRAQGFNITRQTLAGWVEKYPIGAKVVGRFYIHPDKLALLLKGEVKKRVTPLK